MVPQPYRFSFCIITKVLWRSIYIYVSQCFSVAPVRQEICHYRWKKSTKALESKMCQISLGINQSCSNSSHVQISSQNTQHGVSLSPTSTNEQSRSSPPLWLPTQEPDSQWRRGCSNCGASKMSGSISSTACMPSQRRQWSSSLIVPFLANIYTESPLLPFGCTPVDEHPTVETALHPVHLQNIRP